MYKKVFISTLLACIFILEVSAQDTDLLKALNDSMVNTTKRVYASGTFKGTHILNLQSVEQPGKKVLQFIIMHRFGKLNDGAYNFFGLDNAVLRLGLDYGLTNDISVGIGRSSLDKALDASFKVKLLKQTVNADIPVSVSLFSSLVYPTIKYSDKPYLTSVYRMIYTSQLLVARKWNESFSLQLVPTFMHFNLVPTATDKNNFLSLGAGGRMKVTKRMSINAEYDFLPKGQFNSLGLHNALSAGIDIETGGHVFQLIFTNAQGMNEPYFMSRTNGSWKNGDIYFGFNISRVFDFKKRK